MAAEISPAGALEGAAGSLLQRTCSGSSASQGARPPPINRIYTWPSVRSFVPLPRQSCFTRRTWSTAFLPFLKLRESAEEPFWSCFQSRHVKLAEAFVGSSCLWLVMVFLTLYMMLVISSTTFEFEVVKDHAQTVQKEPKVGRHYLLVLIAKELVQVLLMHHLCGNLMDPLAEMREHRATDLEAMQPMGVVHWLRKVWSCMRRREHKPKWLSTFVADHLLLLLAGSLSLIHQVNILFIKLYFFEAEVSASTYLVGIQQSAALQVILSVLSFYTSVLVMGFLMLTLEESVVARPHRRREYLGTMALFILLWSSNFLTILFDRQVLTSAFTMESPGTRILAAAAMVFVTHSSVMMGAVLCGHSAHFKRCPDMTWRVFCSRGIPLGLLNIVFMFLVGGRRFVHVNEPCRYLAYKLLAQPWPYFWTAWTTLGGGWLLWLALTESRAAAHHGARSEEVAAEESLFDIMDYDTVLVLATFSVAVCWNVAKVFEMEASSCYASMLSYFLALLAPFGLASFALVVWKRPPKAGTWRGRSLWFALLFTSSMFADFQEKEDCEISSDMPSCCSYPWFPDYNSLEGMRLKCNKDLRCQLNEMCTIDEDDAEPEGHSTPKRNWTAHALSSSSTARSLSRHGRGRVRGGGQRPLDSTAAPHYSKELCEVLSRRWGTYLVTTNADGYLQAMQDAARKDAPYLLAAMGHCNFSGNAPVSDDQHEDVESTGRETSNHELCLPLDAIGRQLQAPTPQSVRSEADACCISWLVNTFTKGHWAQPEAEVLLVFHTELVACVELVDAVILEDNAMSGLVLCRPLKTLEMNKEDVAIRFGQLLCRWASLQEPAFHLNVGVDVGSLTSFQLPSSGRLTYTGRAVSGARYLAHTAEQEQMVHLSKRVREGLCKLASLQMMVSPKQESFYLASHTAIVPEARNSPSHVRSTRSGRSSHGGTRSTTTMREQLQVDLETATPEHGDDSLGSPCMALETGLETLQTSAEASAEMTFEEFEKLLSENEVDIDAFGKGQAMTLQELHTEIIVNKDSHLIVASNSELKRVKEVLRISLFMRGCDNRLRELRIAAQRREGGTIRHRNQKLAMVIRMRAGDSIKESLEACFQNKFDLTLKDQKHAFDVDWDSLTFKEESMVSATVPGIATTYKMHTLVVNVRDKTHPELSSMGLPAGTDFTTMRDDQEYFWTWALVGNSKEDELLDLLHSHGIESGDFSMAAFAELYEEVYETGLSELEVQDNHLVRKIRIIKVWLHANILSVEHVLSVKRKIQKGKGEDAEKGRTLAMRTAKDTDWEQAVQNLFIARLGIDTTAQTKSISIDPLSYRLSEEVAYSRTFPGLKTVYLIDEVTARVVDTECPTLAVIGLPDGHDCAFSRMDSPKGPGSANLVIQHWCWQPLESFRKDNLGPSQRALLDRAQTMVEITTKRRLPVPDPGVGSSRNCFGSTGTLLERLLKGKKTDWNRARRAASRIRDQRYTCRDFHEDVTAAFPELSLYLEDGETSSGRSGDDEYQRTMGAMFAVYWLMRLHLDGGQCFAYGLGQDWNLRRRPGGHNRQDEKEWEARQAFYEEADWESLRTLLVSAGMLLQEERRSQRRTSVTWLPKPNAEKLGHDEERTLAMLVLTAIHDIMKVQKLLPVVSKTPWQGYQVGDTIHDHDQALAYVLERHPKVLPSFAGLSREEQAGIIFSQSKMEYNMGWLLQAEAPPGALLRKFRETVISGKALKRDIAFYFVHWFTDLAGAEPCPLEGCEKFVLKFPKKVLNQFLQSFSFIEEISEEKSETQIVESYMDWRWAEHEPSLGEVPTGRGATARMRLVIMAQGDSQAVLRAFDELSEEDRLVLADEMALTGCRGQRFARETTEQEPVGGPAFLIYYGPALMQKAGKENPTMTLKVMAEVYRQARALWPLFPEKADETVTVRIDALKVLSLDQVLSHDNESVWILSRLSGKEATVQIMPVSKVPETDWSVHRALEFHDESRLFSVTRNPRYTSSTGCRSRII